jgi:Xaa-Pro dipeptidase
MEEALTRPTASNFTLRQKKLGEAIRRAGLDGLVLNAGPSLVYLTGLHFHLSERPVVAFFTPDQPLAIALPELEVLKTRDLPYELQAFPYQEDPNSWLAAFTQAGRSAGIHGRRVGVEPNRLRLLEFWLLEEAAAHARFESAEQVLATLRIQKDASEIDAMRKAVDIAQRALTATLPLIRTGMTENELASELVLQTLRAGSDGELPFTPIVSAGPNGANPHAVPTPRPLQAGELLVIDWGAAHAGYFSDLTRTFALGEVTPEWQRIAAVVEQANAAGRNAARPGVTAGEVDAAARRVIEEAGYGQQFIHRTGLGLGMEGHEEPYIRAGNPLVLAEGMTFTIEPGIYIPGKNGVRIEDNLAITANGAETLSSLARELLVVGG